MSAIVFTIPGDPIGKPRMTQQDKFAKRDCVVRYWKWANLARITLYRAVQKHTLPKGLYDVSWVAFIGMADSWSEKKKARLRGKPHFGKPDRDNIDKALLDSLFADDRGVCHGMLTKLWDDGNGPRLEVTITPFEGEMP